MIRWAILGAGAIAARFAADMRHSRTGRITAIGSRSTDKARRFAAAIHTEIPGGTIDAVLHRPDVDAVYVATPNALHREHALAALAAGKPVLVEKPLASSASDARDIAQAAAAAGLLAMEAMWMRFTPGIVRLVEIVRSGAIGDIRRIEASLSFDHSFDPGSALYAPEGGGALTDLGVYPVSLALQLAGRPTDIRALAVQSPSGAPAAASLVLSYRNALATLSCGFDAEGLNQAVITGTRGIVTAHRPVLCPPMLSLRRTGSAGTVVSEVADALPPKPERFAALPALKTLARAAKVRRIPTVYVGSGLHYQADHFAHCLAKGLADSPVMPLAESIAVLEMIERALAQTAA
ncbi:Gfo/Idh/MocA family protein [Mangrovicella endophytica]|uniref:Gfo/Idh/MocA family protein n=1 Tax=Mangrovicella endophytica TaxID=2066697 RepID=UPI000C9E1EB8|nr:Gfo/Idh/MocA family oxidoreductase [Mangrovicella endophytica]